MGASNWKVDADYIDSVILRGATDCRRFLMNVDCYEVERHEYEPDPAEKSGQSSQKGKKVNKAKQDKTEKTRKASKERHEKEKQRKRSGLAPEHREEDEDAIASQSSAGYPNAADAQASRMAAQDRLLSEMRHIVRPLEDDDPVKRWAEQVMKQLKKDLFFLDGYVSGDLLGASLEVRGIKDIEDAAEPAPSFLLLSILAARWRDVIQRLRCDARRIAFERPYPWTERKADDWRFRGKTAAEILVLDMVGNPNPQLHREVMESLCAVLSDLDLWDKEYGDEGKTIVEIAAATGNRDFIVYGVIAHTDFIRNKSHSFADSEGVQRNAFDCAWGKSELLDALEICGFPRKLVPRGQVKRAQVTAHYQNLRAQPGGKRGNGKGEGSDKGDKGKGDKGPPRLGKGNKGPKGEWWRQ